MTLKAFTDKRIHVFGGRQWRPLLNVEDAAEAYLACLEADLDKVGNQVFNVGSTEQNYQIDEIAQMVGTSLGGVAIERDESSLDTRDYRVSFEKIQAAIGFGPRQNVPDSARTIYEALSSGAIDDPTEKIYYNHYFDSSEE
jgi:nucleoside-diphosphate-sugar epimerase